MIEKILVVDDEPGIVKMMKSRLEANHYQVIIANDGEECIRKIVSDKPDLVILDIMMPKMSGYEVLIALKERWAIPGGLSKIPPVVVLTASVDEKIRGLIEKEEIRAFILKPFNAADLLKTIANIGGKDQES